MHFIDLLISVFAGIIVIYLNDYLPDIQFRKVKVYLRFFNVMYLPKFRVWLFEKRYTIIDIKLSAANIINILGLLYATVAFFVFTYAGMLVSTLIYLKSASLLKAYGSLLCFLAYAILIPYLYKKAFFLKQKPHLIY